MLIQGLKGNVRAQHSVDIHTSALVAGPGTDSLPAAASSTAKVAYTSES